jgi:YHS domain-containing protein
VGAQGPRPVVLRYLLLLLLFWLIARAFWRLMEGVVRGATSAGPQASGSSRATGAVKMSKCPICGTYVVPGKAISLTRDGEVFYFCGDSHRVEFQGRR